MWKKLTGFNNNYSISINGDIRSDRYNRILSPYTDIGGYRRIFLPTDKTRSLHFVHILVFSTFGKALNDGEYIDHMDRNKENNNFNNLRICSAKMNQYNRGKIDRKKGCSSKYKGVSLKRSGRWHASICDNGRCLYIGSYATEKEAARAYDMKLLEIAGEFACTNEELYNDLYE